MTKQEAKRIWDVLTTHAGANKSEYVSFCYTMSNGCQEYRFIDKLGFGGKLYNILNKIYISCYKEDETPERLEIINKVNNILSNLD